MRDKLERKLLKSKSGGTAFAITPDNLFESINDLAEARLLHLHTTPFPDINRALLHQLSEEGYELLEGPTARVWDHEYRELFRSMGVATVDCERMYASVHYVVAPNTKRKIQLPALGGLNLFLEECHARQAHMTGAVRN